MMFCHLLPLLWVLWSSSSVVLNSTIIRVQHFGSLFGLFSVFVPVQKSLFFYTFFFYFFKKKREKNGCYWLGLKLWWKNSNVTEKNSSKNLLPFNNSEGGGEFECFSVHVSFYKLFPKKNILLSSICFNASIHP